MKKKLFEMLNLKNLVIALGLVAILTSFLSIGAYALNGVMFWQMKSSYLISMITNTMIGFGLVYIGLKRSKYIYPVILILLFAQILSVKTNNFFYRFKLGPQVEYFVESSSNKLVYYYPKQLSKMSFNLQWMGEPKESPRYKRHALEMGLRFGTDIGTFSDGINKKAKYTSIGLNLFALFSLIFLLKRGRSREFST